MIGWIRVNRGKKRNTYYVVIPWDRMDGSGKRKKWQLKYDEQGFRLDSEGHAEQTLGYFRVLIKDGHFNPLDWVEKKPHAFEVVAKTYLKDQDDAVTRRDISPSTPVYKERYMRLYYLPFFAGRDVKHIISLDLKHFYNQLPTALGAKSRLNIMAEIERFFGWCKDERIIKQEAPQYNGMRELRKRAREERPKPRESTHMMSEEDFEKAIIQLVVGDRPIFSFIRETGCRSSEARALLRSDTDWKANIIEIKRTFVEILRGDVLAERAKSGSNRRVYFTDTLKTIIKSVPPRLDTPFVFYNPKTGTAYTKRELEWRWRHALKQAGIPHMALKNATRANAVCELLKLGYSHAEAGAFVGHTNESTTRHYGSIFMDKLREMGERRQSK